MILEDEEIERLMARKKAIQATLAAQASAPAQGGCSSGGCGSAGKAASARAALPRNPQGQQKRAVLLLSLLRVAGLAAAAGVGLWALVQAL